MTHNPAYGGGVRIGMCVVSVGVVVIVIIIIDLAPKVLGKVSRLVSPSPSVRPSVRHVEADKGLP